MKHEIHKVVKAEDHCFDTVKKDMVEKENFEGNNYANDNGVMFDSQNGKSYHLAFCNNKYTASAVAEALNLLDNLEEDGITLEQKG